MDANDPERIQEAREELCNVMDNDHLRGASLLVYANKQDLPNSMSCSDIAEKLQLNSKFRSRPWFLQGAVAVTGEGLYEGLDWLSTTLNK